MTNHAYKMLKPGRIAPIQGSFMYPAPGEWTKKIAASDLSMCSTGYHVARTTAEILTHRATEVWLCEYDGVTVDGEDKLLVQRVKLVKQLMGQREWVLFAADCAEHVLSNFEAVYPDDLRPRAAIEAARAYALDPSDANRDAAWSAARSAGSAWSAGSARSAASSAESAAESAARSAWSAARSAWFAANAANAAEAEERNWQYQRLQQYLDGTAGV